MARKISGMLDNKARNVTGEALQGALIDLIDLGLAAKQAHWNLVGPRFRSIHLQLDDVVNTARSHADLVAERAAAIGVNPDGRAATVARESEIHPPDMGWLNDDKVVAHFVGVLGGIAGRMRGRIRDTADPDPVTQDLFLDVTAELEKHLWMWQAES